MNLTAPVHMARRSTKILWDDLIILTILLDDETVVANRADRIIIARGKRKRQELLVKFIRKKSNTRKKTQLTIFRDERQLIFFKITVIFGNLMEGLKFHPLRHILPGARMIARNALSHFDRVDSNDRPRSQASIIAGRTPKFKGALGTSGLLWKFPVD